MRIFRRFMTMCLLLAAVASATGQTVNRVEYYWDHDPGRGRATPITGFSPSSLVNLNATIPTAGLTPGLHTLGVRGRSSTGIWSATGLHQVMVGDAVQRIEYFYDTDPGLGQGMAYSDFSMSDPVVISNARFSATGISDGFHRLGLRCLSGGGLWSPTYWQTVVVNSVEVSQIEYFFDTDPGFGGGIAYTAFTPARTVTINNAHLSAAGISDGFHRIGLRAKAANGMWSPTYWQTVVVNSVEVSQIEYFFDTDPGLGSGTAYTEFTPARTVSINNAHFSAAGVSDGFHRIGLRAKGANGMWSPTYWQTVVVNSVEVNQIEYFFDTDPGFGSGTVYTDFTPARTVTISNARLSAAGVSDGFHRIGLRAKAANGMWSPTYWQTVVVNNVGVAQIEYFWDGNDPGFGQATDYSNFTPGPMVEINGATLAANLPTGVHTLFLRSKAANGMWSATYQTEVYVGQGADYAEYFWDSDPGWGHGTPITFSSNEVALVNLSNIPYPTSDGLHVLYVRSRAGEIWSPTYYKTYCNAPTPHFTLLISNGEVCQNEQFIIADESEGTTSATKYLWDFNGDGVIDDRSVGDNFHTYSTPGTYTLRLGIGNDTSCQNHYEEQVKVRSISNPSISISNDKNYVCYGETIRFVAQTRNTEGLNPMIQWYRNDTLLRGIEGDTVYFSDLRNNDRIRAVVRVSNHCSSLDTATSNSQSMRIYDLPNVTMSVPAFVLKSETAFLLSNRFTATPTGGTYSINGNTATLFNPARNDTGRYEVAYSYTNNNGCKVTVTDTFELCTAIECTNIVASESRTVCERYSWRGHTYTASGTHRDTLHNAINGVCDSIYELRLTVHHPAEVNERKTVCTRYTWHGNTYTTSDTYRSVKENAVSGVCDSVYILQLTVYQNIETSENKTVCDRYTWHGNTYTTSDTYRYVKENAVSGVCDSVYILQLTVYQNAENSENKTVCDRYTWHGKSYTTSGTYRDTVRNAVGSVCDSFYRLKLTVNHSSTATETRSACGSYAWHGETYTASTSTATYHTTNAAGCDSVTTLHLTITPQYTITFNGNGAPGSMERIKVCAGESVVLPPNAFMQVGISRFAGWALSSNGEVEYRDEARITPTGDIRLWAVWNDTCINAISTETVDTTCDSYNWRGRRIDSTGRYRYVVEHAVEGGCDSIYNLSIVIVRSSSSVETIASCGSYDWHDSTYSVSTSTATFKTVNAVGCDSTVTLHLTVKRSYTITFKPNGGTGSMDPISACIGQTVTLPPCTFTREGYRFMGWGITYGDYSDGIAFPDGDEFVLTDVGTGTYSTLYAKWTRLTCDDVWVTVRDTVCNRYTFRGNSYTASGTYRVYKYGCIANGCDSIFQLKIIVNRSKSSIEWLEACDSQYWHGKWYYTSVNNAIYETKTTAGCDSTVTLNLTLKPHVVLTYDANGGEGVMMTQEVCKGENITLFLNSYRRLGYTFAGWSTYSWGSVVYHPNDNITLTRDMTLYAVWEPSCRTVYDTLQVAACESYDWRGRNYVLSGTYNSTASKVIPGGCDSIYVLRLTIGHANTGIRTVEACDSYEWHGTTYTESTTTATFRTTNVSGCDSIVTLHLTILPKYTVTYKSNGGNGTMVNDIVCSGNQLFLSKCVFSRNGYSFVGWALSPTGAVSYNDEDLVSVTGNMTLYAVWSSSCSDATQTTYVTACDDLSWQGKYYTNSGTFQDTIFNAIPGGCDSISVLHLTIVYSKTTNETIHTEESTYEWNGSVYSTSGLYSWVGMTQDGCDSIVTLDLYLNETVTSIGIDESPELSIYPVPTNGIVNVVANDIRRIEIFDLQGRKMNEWHNVNVINIDGYAEGGYVLRITLPTGAYIRRVIKR